jgi:hypothetical protein
MDDVAIAAWRDLVLVEFSGIGTRVVGFLPNLVGALLILAVGYGAAWLLAAGACRLLRSLGVDRLGARHRVAARVGLARSPSEAVGTLVFWSIMAVFVLASVQALGVGAVTTTLDRLVAYVPDLIGAVLTALLGVLAVRFLGGVTVSAAAAAGIPSAPRLGFLVDVLGLGLVTAVTVDQLGLQTNILVLPLTALLAAGGFAIGLAFALGARPIITHILAGHFLKQSLPRDRFVEIDGERGVVERVGPTDTLFKNGERRWSVPNAQLLERIVVR